MHFAVQDTGIGIPKDKLEMVFQPFEQVDGALTRRHRGTGLGLAISAGLVEQMGGRIYAESQVDRGSTFHFTLCLGIAEAGVCEEAAPCPGRQETPLGPLRVLLAEDSLVNQKLVVEVLERRHHTVVVANNGREAIAVLKAQPFDLVLMDVQMPEMDGFEATAAIRAQEKQTGVHLPVIAMTAHALKGITSNAWLQAWTTTSPSRSIPRSDRDLGKGGLRIQGTQPASRRGRAQRTPRMILPKKKRWGSLFSIAQGARSPHEVRRSFWQTFESCL